MSLINDALKRAKKAQQPTPTPASCGPQFRPAAPSPVSPSMTRFVPTLALVLVGLAGLLLGWQWLHQGRTNHRLAGPAPVPTQGQVASKATPAPTPTPPKTAPPAAQRPAAPKANPASTQKPMAAAAPVATPKPARSTSRRQSAAVPTAKAPAAPVASPPAVAPAPAAVAPLKLQAVFYHPNRPSAMISGQTVRVGEQVGGWRVLAISRSSATLAVSGQTNVLSLPTQL